MKKLILIALVLVLIGGVTGYLMYNKPHKSTATATSDFIVDAPALFKEFSSDEAAANAKYINKVVKVRGTVKTIETDEAGNSILTLDADNEMFGVICTIPKDESGDIKMSEVGEEVTVKGVCTGMLMDVVLIRCVLVA